MFQQFSIARFIIGFIIFVLTYMVAALSDDNFFKLMTVGMFVLSLYIMGDMRKGQLAELARKDAECQEKINDIQEQLYQTQSQYEALVQAVIKASDEDGQA